MPLKKILKNFLYSAEGGEKHIFSKVFTLNLYAELSRRRREKISFVGSIISRKSLPLKGNVHMDLKVHKLRALEFMIFILSYRENYESYALHV